MLVMTICVNLFHIAQKRCSLRHLASSRQETNPLGHHRVPCLFKDEYLFVTPVILTSVCFLSLFIPVAIFNSDVYQTDVLLYTFMESSNLGVTIAAHYIVLLNVIIIIVFLMKLQSSFIYNAQKKIFWFIIQNLNLYILIIYTNSEIHHFKYSLKKQLQTVFLLFRYRNA